MVAVSSAQQPASAARTQPVANFVDIAEKAGLTMKTVFGGLDTKKYIIETTGTGVAIFDYDNDGWPDIFFVNGTTLEDMKAGKSGPTNHLYRNNHDGTFTDVTEKAGLVDATGWGQGVCVGDYDNDGWPDLYVTYYGTNRLYHNEHGVFKLVSEKAGVAGNGKEWGAGCAFVDYDRDGHLDLIVANYVDFDVTTAPAPGDRPSCMWKGAPVMCGPRGLPHHKNILYHNRGDGTFEDVSVKAHIDQTNGHFGLGISTLDYDNDGWPDIYVACDSTPSILYHNNRNGTFTDVAVVAGAAFNEDGREQGGMGTTVGDYDGDGRLDIFKTNFSDDTSTLYHNNPDGTFTDVTTAAGLGLVHEVPRLGNDVLRFRQRQLARPDAGKRPCLSRGRQVSPGQQLPGAAHSVPQQRRCNVQRCFGRGRPGHHDHGIVARVGRWRLVEYGAIVGGDQQHERPAQPAEERLQVSRTTGSRSRPSEPNRTVTELGRASPCERGSGVLVDEVRSGSSYYSQSDMRVHFGLGCGYQA